MTTFVLVHGAWHGAWAWGRVTPLLQAAGARTLAPDLSGGADRGLHDHAAEVAAVVGAAAGDRVVLVGHSYAGLVVREAADARADAVEHLVLVDGWAGPDGAGMFTLAPASFVEAIGAAARAAGDGRHVPAPPPAAFGITDPADAAGLAARLRPQPLRTFAETTRLTGEVDRIPGTAVHCRPASYPFEGFGRSLGYRTRALDGPHDVMLTHPEALARLLLDAASFRNGKREL
ncbi:alpha/beta hydrolase family protein [Streptomyces sp. TLI_171]|uniref:alpha/beta hydrolase family protein n=1 Tax=Streptomyces sp. TLI_171 TaxID=1938859 RepID=UPI000C176CDC|nr:alpha/beta hydrolase family protein [Streptomyces sp. TLI_171]RKE17009.1 pimeloyl-ACP methyl ester carboxylesterase [Streptomyces sp. TLI_171]